MEQQSPSLNPAPAAPAKKNNNVLIALGVIAALCLCACVIGFFVFRNLGQKIGQQIENSSDPTQVAAVRSKIASYNLPSGYSEQMALDLGMYRILALVPSNPSKPMIMLMGYNQSLGANQQQMQDQLQQTFEQQTGTPGMTWTTVDEHKATIRGQEVNVVVREGTTSSGISMRQMVTAFEGENGTVLIMAQGDASGWDQALLDTFLASIK